MKKNRVVPGLALVCVLMTFSGCNSKANPTFLQVRDKCNAKENTPVGVAVEETASCALSPIYESQPQAAPEPQPLAAAVHQNNLQERCCTTPCSPCFCCTPCSIVTETIHGTCTALAAAHTSHANFIINADFLYWKSDVDGLAYAATSDRVRNSENPNDTFTTEHYNDLHFKWRPGLRAGLGYLFSGSEHWDLNLDWTYVHGQGTGERALKRNLPAGTTETIFPIWSADFVPGTIEKASGDWGLHFNSVDLSLGRDYFISKKIAIHPHVGMRGALISQKYKVKYDLLFNQTADTHTAHFLGESDYRALGLRTGVDFLWHFTKCFGLYAQCNGSLLYGKFNVVGRFADFILVTSTEGSSSLAPDNAKVHQHFWRSRANFEEGIGLTWERNFNCDKQRLVVSLGYEMSQWPNQNQFGFNEQNLGDLGFQGGTLKVRFDF